MPGVKGALGLAKMNDFYYHEGHIDQASEETERWRRCSLLSCFFTMRTALSFAGRRREATEGVAQIWGVGGMRLE
jgi:hypothetical protein